jgi:hypothetical protein
VHRITGRGTAIAGEILDGGFRVGDRLTVPASVSADPIEVIGVEFADNHSTRESWPVILVALPPQGPEPELLKSGLPPGTVLEISPGPRVKGADRDRAI